MISKIFVPIAIGLVGAACSVDDPATSSPAIAVPDVSVRQHMEDVVTPATNAIWGIEDPQTDGEWQIIDDSAVAVIRAMTAMKEGGSGPNDIEWASNDDWDAYMDVVITAGEMARRAVEARSVDGIYAAGDVMYPPCENCHLKYHPDVAAPPTGN